VSAQVVPLDRHAWKSQVARRVRRWQRERAVRLVYPPHPGAQARARRKVPARLVGVLVILAALLFMALGCASPAGAEERRGLSKAELLLPIAANLADAVATDYAIHRHGAREANPFMVPVVGNRALHFASKAAIGIATSYAGQKLARRGNRRMAKVVVFVGSALAFGAAAHNVSLGR
jgi:hypothetical protein